MVKIINHLIRFVFVVLLGTSVFFQIKVERYMEKLTDEYGFYHGRARLSYMPFVWFYLQSKGWDVEKNRIYWAAVYLPYKEKNLLGRDYLLFNIEYNAYAMQCYYDKDWLLSKSPSSYDATLDCDE